MSGLVAEIFLHYYENIRVKHVIETIIFYETKIEADLVTCWVMFTVIFNLNLGRREDSVRFSDLYI